MAASAKKTPGFDKLKGKTVGFLGKFGYLASHQELVKNEGGKVVDPLKTVPDLIVLGEGVGGNPPAAGAKIQKKHPEVQLLGLSDFKNLVAPTADELIDLFRNGPRDRDFWDKMVDRTQHVGLDLTGADLRKLQLTRVVFYGVVVDDCDFRGATMDDVSFDKVHGAKFDGATMTEGTLNHAENCSFKNATLDGVRWNPAEFTDCDFSGATLKIDCGSHTTAKRCSFKNADLSNGDLDNSRFQGNDFSGANLTKAKLSKSNFTGANLSGANLSGADLRDANLSKCDLRKAKLAGALLMNADLSNAVIDGADFADANLGGAHLTGLDASKAKNLVQKAARAAGPNLRELGKIAKKSKKLETSIELTLGPDESVVLSPDWWTYGSNGFARAGYVHHTPGNELHSSIDAPTFEKAILNLVDFFSRGKPQFDTLKITAKKCPLKGKELQNLAIAAWCEALDLPIPSAEEMEMQAEQAKTESAGLREVMIAEIKGGPAGVKKWNERSDKDRAKIGKLRKLDFSKARLNDALLSGIDFEGAQFQGASMKKTQLDGCALQEANFTSANLANASMYGVKCSDAVFENATLGKCDLRHASFRRGNFRGADLSKADFSHSDLGGADFTNAKLDGVDFDSAKFDEKTVFPPSFELPAALEWKGAGLRPGTKPVVVKNAGSMDFDGFYQLLNTKVEAGRIDNCRKMLKAERFQLFADVKDDSVVGVVRSQTSADRVYSCRLGNDGRFACCTQNLLPCGGLRGAICKHILVLIVGLTKAGQLDGATVDAWIDASKSQVPALDKDLMSETFLRFKGAEAGEIDWRPTETIPEDFYAM